jgi:predicted nucleic acid-binding protein
VSVVLDTSIAVALAVADEEDHVAVRDWVMAQEDELVTTPLVLAEIDHVVERRASPWPSTCARPASRLSTTGTSGSSTSVASSSRSFRLTPEAASDPSRGRYPQAIKVVC